MARLNKIFIIGTIINTANNREFQNTLPNGTPYATVSGQISVARFVGQGKGYNGSDYSNDFFNIRYKRFASMDALVDGTRIMIDGSLKTWKDQENKSHSFIDAESISILQMVEYKRKPDDNIYYQQQQYQPTYSNKQSVNYAQGTTKTMGQLQNEIGAWSQQQQQRLEQETAEQRQARILAQAQAINARNNPTPTEQNSLDDILFMDEVESRNA